MIVVSDSTPLITLMKAVQLDVLNKLFDEIVIPQAVYYELTTNEKNPEEAAQINRSSFIRVVTVDDSRSVSILQRATGLDLGESEAIVYADEKRADLLLIDEAPGRRVAIGMGLEIMGSVGILLAAYREGYISAVEVKNAFEKIRNSNRHISDDLIKDALDILRQ